MFGFAGAHRTGKTTLMKEVAKHLGIAWVETNVSKVFEDLSLSPRETYPFETTLQVQEAILDKLEAGYEHVGMHEQAWITDRTPLDVLAYTMADIGRTTLTDERLRHAYNRHMTRCIRLTQRWFDDIVIISPGIPAVDEPGKAPPCPAYRHHLTTLLRAMPQWACFSDDELGLWILPSKIVELDERVRQCLVIFDDKIAARGPAQIGHRTKAAMH
jgi:hypothetical protein